MIALVKYSSVNWAVVRLTGTVDLRKTTAIFYECQVTLSRSARLLLPTSRDSSSIRFMDCTILCETKAQADALTPYHAPNCYVSTAAFRAKMAKGKP